MFDQHFRVIELVLGFVMLLVFVFCGFLSWETYSHQSFNFLRFVGLKLPYYALLVLGLSILGGRLKRNLVKTP